MDTSRPLIRRRDFDEGSEEDIDEEGAENSDEEGNAGSEDESAFHPSALIERDLQPPVIQPESLSITMTQVHAGELGV